jgi:hypothetical protein
VEAASGAAVAAALSEQVRLSINQMVKETNH